MSDHAQAIVTTRLETGHEKKHVPGNDRMRAIVLFVCVAALTMPSMTPLHAQEREVAQMTSDDQRGGGLLGAIGDSMKLLMIEHGIRIAAQPKTRHELGGPFWSDYRRSARWPGQWDDTDAWWVNYIGHPIHGAAAGLIYLDHTGDHETPFALRREYWSSRGRAAAFSALYSVQFEVGPLSEASIGNVGMRPETTGWVDYVITPVGALGLLAAEDAMDRWIVERIERRTSSRFVKVSVRMLFNPSRTLANLAQTRAPWSRPGRPLH